VIEPLITCVGNEISFRPAVLAVSGILNSHAFGARVSQVPGEGPLTLRIEPSPPYSGAPRPAGQSAVSGVSVAVALFTV
jgi:hypothetical protein